MVPCPLQLQISFRWLLILLLTWPTVLHAQQMSDWYADSLPIQGETFSLRTHNVSASAEPGEPPHLGSVARRSLWGAWKPGTNGQARLSIRTIGARRLRLAVYTGESLTNLTLVAGLANAGTNSVHFEVSADVTYRFVVDVALRSTSGEFELAGNVTQLILHEPLPQARLRAPTNITLRARPAPGRELNTVEFFANDVSLGVQDEPPFVRVWPVTRPGVMRFRAVGTNSAGLRLESHEAETVVRPANDDRADAAVIPAETIQGTVSGDCEFASPEAIDADQDRSLWWRWKPSVTGFARFTVPTSMYGLSLTVFRGPAVSNLVSVARLDPVRPVGDVYYPSEAGEEFWLNLTRIAAGTPTTVETGIELATLEITGPLDTFLRLGEERTITWRLLDRTVVLKRVELVSGSEVLATTDRAAGVIRWRVQTGGIQDLRLRGWTEAGVAHFSFPWTVSVPPANDQFDQPEILPGDRDHLTFTNRSSGLSWEPQERPHAGNASLNSLWWMWTPVKSGLAELHVAAPGFQSLQLAAYTGDSLTNLVTVGDNRTARGPDQDRLLFPVTAGQTYRLVVDGMSVEERRIVVSLSRYAVGLELPLQAGDVNHGETNRIRLRSYDPDFVPAGGRFFLDGDWVGEASGLIPSLDLLLTNLGPQQLTAMATNAAGEAKLTPVTPIHVSVPHDHWRNAYELPDNFAWRYEGTLAGSTWENFDRSFFPEGGSVWLKWRAPFTGQFVIRTGGDALFRLHAWFGVDEPTPLEWEYSEPGLVVASCYASVDYYIRVASISADRGAFSLEIEPPPVNDHLEDAIPLAGLSGPMVGTNRVATAYSNEPSSGLKGTLWWRWTPPATGNVTFAAGQSDCSVGVSLFRGTDPRSSLQIWSMTPLVTFGADGKKQIQSAVFPVRGGVQYWIALGPIWGGGGPYWGTIRGVFSLTRKVILVANDDLESPVVIPSEAKTFAASNRKAPDDELSARSVWFEWTAPMTGAVALTARSSEFRPLISIGFGLPHGQWSLSGFSGWLAPDEPLYMSITKRDSYLISVGGPFTGPSEGSFELFLDPFPLPPAPVNDAFASRTRISSAPFADEFQLMSATLEELEPEGISQGFVAPRRGSVWWEYLPDTDGYVILDTVEPQELSVFKGNALRQLQPVESLASDKPVIVPAKGGEPLVFAAHGWRWQPHSNRLELTFAPVVPPNDNLLSAARVQGSSVAFRGFLRGASRESEEPSHLFDSTTDQSTGESAWWSWTAPFSGQATVTQPRANLHRMGIYQGTDISRLRRVEGSRTENQDMFVAQGGETYLFGIERLAGSSGWVEAALRLEPFNNAPSLAFALGPGGLELTWPPDFRLQRTLSLLPALWQNLTNASPFTVPLGGTGEFYRAVPAQ